MGNIIVLFGKPGAGKGTRLSKFLEGRETQFDVLSVSNLLKKAVKEQTKQGKIAESYMNSGNLVPDDIVNNIVIEGIKSAEKDVFIDGFPRTVVQAKAMLDAGVYPNLVIEFYVDDEIVLQRAKDRIVCNQCGEPYTTNSFKRPKTDGICDKCNGKLIRRKDDEESVVRKRLEVYQNETYPVLDVFKSVDIQIHTIDNTSKNSVDEFEKLLTY